MAANKKPAKQAALSVKAYRNGYRRAGRAWSAEPTLVPLESLTEEQVAMLKADRDLVVTETELDTESE